MTTKPFDLWSLEGFRDPVSSAVNRLSTGRRLDDAGLIERIVVLQ